VDRIYDEEKGITFASVDGVELKLDIATPAGGEAPFPALVFICGGGWRMVGRDTLSEPVRWAAERGYVAATIDYRSTLEGVEPRHPFPAQVHDAKCAVRWLRTNADAYNIDPSRIGAVGWEAGGSLALLLALADSADGLEGDCGDMGQSSAVGAAVSLAGPADLALLYDTTGENLQYDLTRLLGGPPDESPENYRLASPVTYVSADDPPVLSLMGQLSERIPPEQGELLDASMRGVGASHTLTVLEGKDGSYFGNPDPALYDMVFDFLDDHLK
jgi:acetyl esterase/lipase